MSNLGPQQQNESYSGLLQVPGGVTYVVKTVQDGEGNNTPLKLGSSVVQLGDVVNTSILQIPGGVTSSLQSVLDGNGNLTGLQLSSTGANVTTSDSYLASKDAIAIPNVVARQISDGFGDIVSVKDFGATGDGVTDDSAAIQDAVDSGYSIYFPAGDYNIETQITISASGVKFYGEGVASKLTSANLINPILLSGVSDTVFEDLFFEVTLSQASDNSYGIVRSINSVLSNTTFFRCKFSAPSANTNAVKIIAETADVAERVYFIECLFDSIWRMGVEVQNHNYSPNEVRYRAICFDKCLFKDLGTLGGYGYSISLSGLGESCIVSNNVFDNVKLGLELVGASDTTVAFNKFSAFVSGGSAFSFTGSFTMYRNRLIGNTMEASNAASIKIWTQTDLVLQGNYLQSAGYVYFRDVTNVRASDEQYETTGAYAVFIEGTSYNNRFVNCSFSNAGSASNNSCFRTYGASVTDTQLLGCSITQGTGGVPYDGNNSAEPPVIYYCDINSILLSTPIRAGYSYKTGIYDTVSGSISTRTINFSTSSSWRPAIVSVRVRSLRNDNNGSGYTENRLYIGQQGSTNIQVVSNQVIGTATGLTITTSTSGTILTITCTHASISGPNFYFIWDLEVDSYYTPIIT